MDIRKGKKIIIKIYQRGGLSKFPVQAWHFVKRGSDLTIRVDVMGHLKLTLQRHKNTRQKLNQNSPFHMSVNPTNDPNTKTSDT